MTRARPEQAIAPAPPSLALLGDRLLVTRQEAAHIVCCRDTAQFQREVRQGIWPKPVRPGRWDLQSLRDRVAFLAGRVPASAVESDDLAEELASWQPPANDRKTRRPSSSRAGS